MKVVLLIEDNSDILENTCELLELEGYKVIVASNGEIGVELATENDIDIILCDIMMPLKDGYEVFHALKRNSKTLAIPFIFFTASAEKKEAQAALDMGANGYIKKPFEVEELFSTIKRSLL